MRSDPPGKLLLGLLTGAAFGVLLQKSRAARYETIQGQLSGRDNTVVKVMGTAVAVAAPLAQALFQRGLAKPEIKPMAVGGVGLGAVLFGSGLALLGYCPGTSVAAAGEGRRDAISGVAGMLTGAALFVRLYPKLKPAMNYRNYGKLTLPQATHTPIQPWIAGLASAVATADAALPSATSAD